MHSASAWQLPLPADSPVTAGVPGGASPNRLSPSAREALALGALTQTTRPAGGGGAGLGPACHPLPPPPQEVVSHCKKLTKKNKEQLSDMMVLDKQKGLKSLSKEKRQKLEAYQHLFYLLQVSGGLGGGVSRLLRPPCPCHCLLQDVLLRNPTASPKEPASSLETGQGRLHSKPSQEDLPLPGGSWRCASSHSRPLPLLQTQPIYLAKLIFQMPQGKTTKFMESVIFGLYNYASSRREAYLLLQLFKTALQEEVRQVPPLRRGGREQARRGHSWSSPTWQFIQV